jgi:hypothetical protein
MNYVQIPDYIFDRIIKSLQRGYDICSAVDSDSEETEKSPYYANGYSRATIASVLEDLERYKQVSN